MKLARTALFAASLAAAAGPVFADAGGTATFGNLRVTLIDLNPNDGIAASITFLPDTRKFYDGASVKGEAKSWIDQGSFADVHDEKVLKTAAWGSANIGGAAHTDTASMSGSVTASADGTGFNALSVTGSALATPGHLSYFYGTANVPGTNLRNFTLSANTQVVFSVDAAMSVSTDVAAAPGELRFEQSWARMGLYVSGLAGDGVTELVDDQWRSISVGLPGDAIPSGGSDSWSGVISSSFSNLSGHSTGGGFWGYGAIEGGSYLMAAPVPEPATYGMLLGGLGLVGVVARRRRSKQACSTKENV